MPYATLQVGNEDKYIVRENKFAKSVAIGPRRCIPKYNLPHINLHKHHGGVIQYPKNKYIHHYNRIKFLLEM